MNLTAVLKGVFFLLWTIAFAMALLFPVLLAILPAAPSGAAVCFSMPEASGAAGYLSVVRSVCKIE